MQAFKLAIADIQVSDRLRLVNAGARDTIAASMQSRGQINPITVWRTTAGHWRLAAGEHRLSAAKKLGWATIDCTEITMRTEWPDQRREMSARDIEITENLHRANLSSVESSVSHELLVQNARNIEAWEAEQIAAEAEAETAKHVAEAAAARKAEKEARAEAKAAATRAEELRQSKAKAAAIAAAEAETKAAVEALKRAEQDRKASQMREARHATDTPRGVDTVAKRTLTDSYTAVGKAAGIQPVTLRNSHDRITALGGVDAAKELFGTSLCTKAEVTSLGKLRKAYPKEAERLVAQAKKGQKVSAQATLGGLEKERRESERQGKKMEARGDRSKSSRLALSPLHAALVAIEKLKGILRHADLASDLAVATKCTTDLMHMQYRLEQYRHVETAKPNGNEYKYGGTSTSADTEARAKAKRDQDSNAKMSAASLKTA